MKKDKKYNEVKVLNVYFIVIVYINLILAISNVFINSRFLSGVINGINAVIILTSIVRLIISEHNYKAELRKFNKKIGFREDFDPIRKFHLIKRVGDYEVSTVDFGLDHSFGVGEPLYYETMIFKRKESEENPFEYYQKRYATKKEAKKGHKKAIKYVKKEINK